VKKDPPIHMPSKRKTKSKKLPKVTDDHYINCCIHY
jgi:hypothetical protein